MTQSGLLRWFDRRVGFACVVGILLIVLGVSGYASAALVSERSIALSSSSVAATNVTYTVNFTPATPAGAFVVDFCSNSPVVGETCASPSGFDASAAASVTSGFTDVTGNATRVVAAGVLTAGSPVSVALNGMKNPDTDGPLYARIVTFDTKAEAEVYTSLEPGSSRRDEGGVAMAITPTIGVSGSVPESMTFCLSGDPIAANCTVTGKVPSLMLGEPIDDTVALDMNHVSTGSVYTQISTNALSGAVVNLKSTATGCGGLKRPGVNACDISPALNGGIVAGQARVGVKTAMATNTGSDAMGDLRPASGSMYNDASYALNYVIGDTSGVTSAYGDPFLDTAGAPANNKNMALTFGASVASTTPAGTYSADLSLIVTGKF